MPLENLSSGSRVEIHARNDQGGFVGWIFGFVFGSYATAERVEVVPEARRQGWAAKLAEAFIAEARTRGANRITGQVAISDEEASALAFWENQGAQIDECGRFNLDG